MSEGLCLQWKMGLGDLYENSVIKFSHPQSVRVMHSTRPTDSSMGVVHCDIKPQNILATLHHRYKTRKATPPQRTYQCGWTLSCVYNAIIRSVFSPTGSTIWSIIRFFNSRDDLESLTAMARHRCSLSSLDTNQSEDTVVVVPDPDSEWYPITLQSLENSWIMPNIWDLIKQLITSASESVYPTQK